MKEYLVNAFEENWKWFFRLTDSSTWNTIVLTESQFSKCVNRGIKTFTRERS